MYTSEFDNVPLVFVTRSTSFLPSVIIQKPTSAGVHERCSLVAVSHPPRLDVLSDAIRLIAAVARYSRGGGGERASLY